MARRRSRTRGASWSLIAGVGIAGLVIGYLIGLAGRATPTPSSERAREQTPRIRVLPPVPDAAPRSDEPEASIVGAVPEPAGEAASALARIPDGKGSRIAVVIDDLGRSVQDVIELSGLGVPISFSVLPFESRTADVVREVERRGGEMLLHLPMQPGNAADPGPGALLSGMSNEQLEAATRWALDAVVGAAGVNNHMGSELSADAGRMRTILGVLAERNLFFLDSRTSPNSVGYSLALDMGLAAAERQVFLDPEPRPEAIRAQFYRLLELARSRGAAVAIGHPHRETIAVLRVEIPRAVAAGYEFVTVSALAHRVGGAETR